MRYLKRPKLALNPVPTMQIKTPASAMLSNAISHPQKKIRRKWPQLNPSRQVYLPAWYTGVTRSTPATLPPPIYNPFPSQWLGNPPPGLLAQLMTVRLVVYAMATKPKTQSRMSDHRRRADLATPL